MLALLHDCLVPPAGTELWAIRPIVAAVTPHIAFNLMEAFAGVPTFDRVTL